eukprot:Tamp_02290.p1 GENE.Tamp_02290~~Tamp_02290.p1  ORF type:complete len:764 (+),score=219.23 Tamp_02290:52-2292(+)
MAEAQVELPEQQGEEQEHAEAPEQGSDGGSEPMQSTDSPDTTAARMSSGSIASTASVAGSLERVKPEDIAPLAETTPDDMKNFCATQACAQPDDVVTLARATLESLQTLWQEIGLETHECANASAEMFAEVKRVFENKLSSTQEIKCSLVSQTRLAAARITTIEREIGTAEDDSGMQACKAPASLRGQLSAHKEYLKTLEATKVSRAGVLTKKAEELSALLHLLDDAISPEQAKFLRMGTDYTTGRIDQFVSRIQELQALLAQRQAQRASLVKEVRALWTELGMEEEWAMGKTASGEEEDSFDDVIKAGTEEDIKVTAKNLELLQTRVANLEEEKAFRISEQTRLFSLMATLWERTRVPAEESVAFKNAHQALTLSTLQKIEVQIGHLEEVKRAMMQELVAEVRVALTAVWEEMRYSDEDKQFFRPFYQELYTEDTLRLHEEHLSACKERLETMQPILKMFDRRGLIMAEDKAMKEALADPNRLLGRGRGMAEQLKKEEKVRNMVNKELPKLRQKLRAAVAEYEASVGLNLKVNGERIMEMLDEEDATAEMAKEEAKSRRGGGAAGADKAPSKAPASGPTGQTPRGGAKTARERDASAERPTSARGASQERPGSGTSGPGSGTSGSGVPKLRAAAKAVAKGALESGASKANSAAAPKCVGKLDFTKDASNSSNSSTSSSNMPPPPSKEAAGGVFSSSAAQGAENQAPDIRKPSPRTGFGFKAPAHPKGVAGDAAKMKRTITPKASS